MEPDDQILALDDYSIFDLMGLGDMSAAQQQNMLLDINDLVWTNFLGERLTYIFTTEQIKSIKEKMDQGEKIDSLLKYMNQISPNFNNLLAEYTRYFKIDYLRKHYQATINDLNKLISNEDNPEIKTNLDSKLAKNTKALEYINSFQWEEVLKLFYPEDYQD